MYVLDVVLALIFVSQVGNVHDFYPLINLGDLYNFVDLMVDVIHHSSGLTGFA